MSQFVRPTTVDTLSTGVQSLASGSTTITLKIPGSGDSYSMDVLTVAKLESDFDIQKETQNVQDFSFNFPYLKFSVNNDITNDSTGVKSALIQLLETMSFSDLMEVTLTRASSTDYFYATKFDFSYDVLKKEVKIEARHPLLFTLPPIGTDAWTYDDQTYQTQLEANRNNTNEFSGISIPRFKFINLFTSGRVNAREGQTTDSPAELGSRPAIRVRDLIDLALQHYSSGNTPTIVSALYPDGGFTLDKIGSVPLGTDITTTTAEITTSANPILLNDTYAADRTKIPRNEEELKQTMLRAALMEGAYFGHMLGEPFYVCRNVKSSAHQVTLTDDDFLELSASSKRSLANKFDFGIKIYNREMNVIDDNNDYPSPTGDAIIVGDFGSYSIDENGLPNDDQLDSDDSLSHVNGGKLDTNAQPPFPLITVPYNVISRGVYHTSGNKNISINLDTTTARYDVDDSQEETVNKTDTFCASMELNTSTGENLSDIEDAGGDTFDPQSFGSRSFTKDNAYIKRLANGELAFSFAIFRADERANLFIRQIMNETVEGKKVYQHILGSYLAALKAKGGLAISGTIKGVDTLKPYEHITISSTLSPLLNGKDFRLSKVSYDLLQDEIEFEAYEF